MTSDHASKCREGVQFFFKGLQKHGNTNYSNSFNFDEVTFSEIDMEFVNTST